MGDSCACGHSLSLHGRRGYGACRVRTATDAGRAAVASLEHVSRDILEYVVALALALPGMTTACDCKRFHKRPKP